MPQHQRCTGRLTWRRHWRPMAPTYQHRLLEVGVLEHAVPRRPRDDLVVRNEDLGAIACLSKRFLGCDAIAVNVVATSGFSGAS